MPHPSSHLREEIAQLRAELAELRSLVDGRQRAAPPLDPVAPALTLASGVSFIDPNGLPRAANGQPWKDPAILDTRDYTTRRLAARAAFEAEEQGEAKARNAGLPPGQWRDFSGLVRGRDGKLVPATPAVLTAHDKPTANSAPSPYVAQTQSEADAEVVRLRRPDPIPATATQEADETLSRDDSDEVPERPLSLADQLRRKVA